MLTSLFHRTVLPYLSTLLSRSRPFPQRTRTHQVRDPPLQALRNPVGVWA